MESKANETEYDDNFISSKGSSAQHHYSASYQAIQSPQNWEDVIVASRLLLVLHEVDAKHIVLRESQRAFDLAEHDAEANADLDDELSLRPNLQTVTPGTLSLPMRPEAVAASFLDLEKDLLSGYKNAITEPPEYSKFLAKNENWR